jgi:RNA polymerase sigma-70 factor, ECF subfamily
MTSAAVISLPAAASPVGRAPGRHRAGGTADAAVLVFRPRLEPRVRPTVARRAAALPQDFAHDGAAPAKPRPAIVHDADRALVFAIARGSKSAMRTLFMRHQVRVYRFLKRIVHDHAQAEDLTSDVFLAVWRRADLFQGRSRVSTWLCGIARHKALTALQAAPPVCHDQEVMLTVCDPGPGPEGELDAKDKVAMLRRALTALSREHREIIDLVYYRGKSIKQIADMLGIAPNTVKTRMFYARKRLAKLMAMADA